MSDFGEDAMNYIHERPLRREESGDPRLGNPFEEFDEVYPPKPAISIPITDEVRAKDAADRAAREQLNPEHPWAAVKASLAVSNLRTVAPSPGTELRQAGTQAFVLPKWAKVCGCGAQLSAQTKGTLCKKCFLADQAAKPPMCAGTCGQPLKHGAKGTHCRACKTAAAAKSKIAEAMPMMTRLVAMADDEGAVECVAEDATKAPSATSRQ